MLMLLAKLLGLSNTSKGAVTAINLNTAGPNRAPPYPLTQFALLYLLGIACVAVAKYLSPISLIVIYPAISTFISRFVNDRVVWWDQANSVDAVFRAKLGFWLLWPYQLPKYVFKLWVARYL